MINPYETNKGDCLLKTIYSEKETNYKKRGYRNKETVSLNITSPYLTSLIKDSILKKQLNIFFPKDNTFLNKKLINSFSPHKLVLNIKYDGRKFHGNQIQSNQITVEHVLLHSLKQLLPNYSDIPNKVDWCGRTDSNVSADNMICSILINYNNKINWYLKNIQSRLCKYVIVKEYYILKEKEEFSPRFDCFMREYKYLFILPKSFKEEIINPNTFKSLKSSNQPSDLLSLLNEKAKLFLNVNNMKEFCKTTKGKPNEFYERPLSSIEVVSLDNNIDTRIQFELRIKSKSFLHNQIRRILFFILFNRKGNMDGIGLTFFKGSFNNKFDWEKLN